MLMQISKPLLFLSLLFGAACDQNSKVNAPDRVIVGEKIVDIEVLQGSFLTDNCGIAPEDLEAADYACIAFPLSSKRVEGKNWDAEYLNALNSNGWKYSGGEGNAYYLEKYATPDCNYSMGVIGWVQGTEAQVDNYFNTGEFGEIINQTFIFALAEEKKCGDNRFVE